jgi:hypothetical protein
MLLTKPLLTNPLCYYLNLRDASVYLANLHRAAYETHVAVFLAPPLGHTGEGGGGGTGEGGGGGGALPVLPLELLATHNVILVR